MSRTAAKRNDQEKDDELLCWSLVCTSIVITLVAIILLIYFVSMADLVQENDVSLIPYQYKLGHRHYYMVNYRYDYILTSFPGTNKLYTDSTNITNAFSTTNTTNSTFELALEVSRSWKILTPGYYEVQEDRYASDGSSYKVVTAIASYTSWFYIAWGPPITVKFVVTDRPNPLDPRNLTHCEYQFTWTWILNGYVNRKCPGEKELVEVSYVSGSSLFGFYFWNRNETFLYAYSTIPNLDPFGLYERNVYIDPSAPFPPIIPSLYTAYYEYLSNIRRSKQ